MLLLRRRGIKPLSCDVLQQLLRFTDRHFSLVSVAHVQNTCELLVWLTLLGLWGESGAIRILVHTRVSGPLRNLQGDLLIIDPSLFQQ